MTDTEQRLKEIRERGNWLDHSSQDIPWLCEQLEAALKDKERLDWLESNHFIRTVANKSQDACVFAVTMSFPGTTLREGIDQTRAAIERITHEH